MPVTRGPLVRRPIAAPAQMPMTEITRMTTAKASTVPPTTPAAAETLAPE